jgi:valyl-tRNA synthetase
VCDVLARVRRTKTEAKVSQRAAVTSVAVTGPGALIDAVNACRDDLMKTGSIVDLVVGVGDAVTVDVVLAPAG